MSSTVTSAALWLADKTVTRTGYSRHRRPRSVIGSGFVAPIAPTSLTFGPKALAASVARAVTMRGAPADMTARWAAMALARLEYLIDPATTFTLTPNFLFLDDTERPNFAGQVGAGITDLIMNAMNYAWRDNAACLVTGSKAHPDFIYGGGPATGYGVVLAEAHGSFADRTDRAYISRRSKAKYLRQVKPFVGTYTPNAELVLHGYSIAFGANGLNPGAFLSVSETQVPKARASPRRPSPPPSPPTARSSVAAPMALATNRSNFILTGAGSVAAWIDWANGARAIEPEVRQIGFMAFELDGRKYLTIDRVASPLGWLRILHRNEGGPDFLWPQHPCAPAIDSAFGGIFAIEASAANAFLSQLSNLIADRRDLTETHFELPAFAPFGFGFADRNIDRDGDVEGYALFCDGLALIDARRVHSVSPYRTWDAYRGWMS